MYTLSRDDILGMRSSRQDPELFKIRRKQCQEFYLHAHGVFDKLLIHLDKHLGLASGTLSSLAPLDQPSHTTTRLLEARPQPGLVDSRINFPGHTDVGTITMLFHVVGGLQILPFGKEPTESNWRYIRPQQGCALINIGDAFVAWTGGILRSALHRIVTPPGEQAQAIRKSLAYLIRPPHNGSMKRLTSTVIPPLAEGEPEEMRSVDDWATWRTAQIMRGDGYIRPKAGSDRPVGIANGAKGIAVA